MTSVPLQGGLKVGDAVGGFRLELIREISELRGAGYQFVHVKTGARLIHLFNDDDNNLFSIAFRTPVSDSTGVPHILEHSVLCGSKRFPVKDPFQEMLKGSLQTFLNAMTYPDKTVYPVSSQVEKDFYNLVDVYCDAVLNPLLTENTFYQEGWHYDLENLEDAIGIRGIVYNEMKGVFSDFSSHVGRGITSKLFPDTAYFHESGGDPEHIPELTYEQFKDFHKRFYHPSNSFIFVYGNLPSAKTLNYIDERYLSVFDAQPVDSSVAPQPLWREPQTAVMEAPAPSAEEEGSASVVCSWIVGRSADPVDVFSASILSGYLLSTETSPLKRALVDSGLGEDLDDMCGFDADLAQGIFSVGLRKAQPQNAQAILDIIMNTLKNEVENGLDGELIEGAVRQTEFSLREITSGHFPYNLRLADRCYRSWINGGDPFALLAFEGPLSVVKEGMKRGRFFEDFIQKNLIDNKHRLLAVVTASSEKGKKLEAQTEEQAARLTAGFTDGDKKRCLELTNTLREQQAAAAPPEALATLPTLAISDLPREGKIVPAEEGSVGGVTLITHPIFTSGIVYLDVGFDFYGVEPRYIKFIPLYLELLTRCGAGKFTYEQMAKRVSLSTGGIAASTTCQTRIGTKDEVFFMAFLHGKALEPRFGEMLGILEDILVRPELTNKKLIKDLLIEERNSLNSSIIHSGHSFAITDAAARLSRTRKLDDMLGGIAQLRFLDEIVKNEDYDSAEMACRGLHNMMINRRTCVVSMTVGDPSKFAGALEPFVGSLPSREKVGERFQDMAQGYSDEWLELFSDADEFARREADSPTTSYKGIEINSAVNFAARAWRLPDTDAADKGLAYLLSRNLSTGYLWDKVRVEGGAYGGMSGSSVGHPVFSCASYRDPNLESTLAHFVGGLSEAAGAVPKKTVDQSIIGAIGRIDQPKPPHTLGFSKTMEILSGSTEEYRQQFREAVLGTTPEDLKRAAERVLAANESAVTVLGSSAALDKAQWAGIGFEREKLIPC
ncbi:MAG: insulinase family protein [Chitinispirillales bacterium]|jgi:Zn-dependent M16 (insulinase) family peptidase|nr:insulinase family protein [Chitinispirillales bacterium]